MKITKEVTFDSAHMLSNYSGKCNNLHGHTYKLQIEVKGGVNDKTCMLIDFNELKEIIDTDVMQMFDHALIFSASECREEAEEALYKWAKKYNKKHYVMSHGKTTCEFMAPEIKNVLYKTLGCMGFDVKVKLWETPTSFAEC